MDTINYNQATRDLIDDLKAVCASYGLGNDGNEYKVITQSFLYKFLNDKFIYDFKRQYPELAQKDNLVDYLASMREDEYSLMIARLDAGCAKLKPAHLLEYLFKKQNNEDFAKLFDDTLNDIAIQNNDIFSVHDQSGSSIRLFDEQLIQRVVASKHSDFARAIINKLANSKFDFDKIFSEGFDFFSTLFEYMIKDYNKDGGGKYAEYYTPHSIAKIMAEILIGDDEPQNVTAYDPSAGSGTLLMNIASRIGTDKCTIYSQDISQKSSNLLRLNLILNNLAHSINHITQGNTITNPAHAGKKFDFIVSNPPFKLDFSDDVPAINSLPNKSDRFFAGVPNIPKQSKDKMAIYLLFIQHIMWSLSEGTGRAAVVVPTGFITAQSGIEKSIREKLVSKKWLKGVVSMPSNIFATTGTNVSVILIDKGNSDKVVLVDASKLGKKVKDGKNQKTLLSVEDEQKIIGAFKTTEPIEDFSVVVDYDEIKEKNYSLSAGQYFDIKIEHIDITPEEFEAQLSEHKAKLAEYFAESKKLEVEIEEQLGKLKYE
ncbi:type I restriction-modification system subunit M [Christensenellaceae bacterium OttesenSCG-928-L17]|nr:type I restriction-modification system subunit M [Christensenellaceae bacterium OttesenSCG-928-L17]